MKSVTSFFFALIHFLALGSASGQESTTGSEKLIVRIRQCDSEGNCRLISPGSTVSSFLCDGKNELLLFYRSGGQTITVDSAAYMIYLFIGEDIVVLESNHLDLQHATNQKMCERFEKVGSRSQDIKMLLHIYWTRREDGKVIDHPDVQGETLRRVTRPYEDTLTMKKNYFERIARTKELIAEDSPFLKGRDIIIPNDNWTEVLADIRKRASEEEKRLGKKTYTVDGEVVHQNMYGVLFNLSY